MEVLGGGGQFLVSELPLYQARLGPRYKIVNISNPKRPGSPNWYAKVESERETYRETKREKERER